MAKGTTFILNTLAVIVLLGLLIVQIHAQPAPPPPDDGVLRERAEVLASHMIELEEEAAANQNTIIDLQVSELNRLESSPPDGPDETGKAARAQFKMLAAKQDQIRAQLRTLAGKLQAIPRPAQPRNLMMELMELKDIREDQGRGIAEGFKEIRSLLSGEDAEDIPGDETDDSEDEDSDEAAQSTEGEEKTPETVKDATDIIGGGKVKTPKHLIEIFERISTDKTPSGNLNYFRRQQM